jgi:ferredoxin-type protein NapG
MIPRHPVDHRMSHRRISRRKALSSALALGATATLLGAVLDGERAEALPQDRIRPPGALPESEFLAACVRCGLCVQACPYATLKLGELHGAVPAGTPYFVARRTPCEMCATIPCAAVCPTGALRPTLADIRDADMGLARLSTPRRCLSYTGAAYCESCFRACPLEGEAIRMKNGRTRGGGNFMPVIDPDRCTGCGKCEKACVVEGVAAITVLANHAVAR